MRPNPGQPPEPAHVGQCGGRLNLLLSFAGWQPDSWVDHLPPLLEPMGITSLRAQSGCQARRVIQTSRIHIAIVDLGLPLEEPGQACADRDPVPDLDEGGPRLLELLARLEEPPPVIAVKRRRSERDNVRDLNAALRLGAFAVVDRPRELNDLNLILNVLRRCLERHYQGRWPG